MATLYERRIGPHKSFPPPWAPATQWNPILPGQPAAPARDRFIRTQNEAIPLPTSDQDIAFAPLSQLSRWIETRKLTSERSTRPAPYFVGQPVTMPMAEGFKIVNGNIREVEAVGVPIPYGLGPRWE